MERLVRSLYVLLAGACAGCGWGSGPPAVATSAQAAAPAAAAHGAAITDTAATGETDGQWVRPAGDYASTRYSALGEITVDRVRELTVKASMPTGNARGHEAAPLVIGGRCTSSRRTRTICSRST